MPGFDGREAPKKTIFEDGYITPSYREPLAGRSTYNMPVSSKFSDQSKIHDVSIASIQGKVIFHEFFTHTVRLVPEYDNVYPSKLDRYVKQEHPVFARNVSNNKIEIVCNYRVFRTVSDTRSCEDRLQLKMLNGLTEKDINILQVKNELIDRLPNAGKLDLLFYFAARSYQPVSRQFVKMIGDLSNSELARITGISRNTISKYYQIIEERRSLAEQAK